MTMRFGVVIPIACNHEMQAEALESVRRHSEPQTLIIALLQGEVDVPLPQGVTSIRVSLFDDEVDLWAWGLATAIEKNWDWCLFVHDDFAMLESGWEDQLRASSGWRVALASWAVYSVWDAEANTSQFTSGPVGVCLDSMAFAFRTDVFRERGCVSEMRYGFGYGAWDACAYALANGMGVWRVHLNSKHQWVDKNSRAWLGKAAPGHPECRQAFRSKVLPSRVVDETAIEVCGVRHELKGPTAMDREKRTTSVQLNYDQVRITNE